MNRAELVEGREVKGNFKVGTREIYINLLYCYLQQSGITGL
jgi:hypothetical protein